MLCFATAVLCTHCVPTDPGENLDLTIALDTAQSQMAEPSANMDSVIAVIRRRAEELGAREVVIQKIGDDTVSVMLRGIDDPDRATSILLMRGQLEFRITDMSEAFKQSLPDIDAVLPVVGGLTGFLFGGTLPGEFLVREHDVPRVDSLMRLDEFSRVMPEGIDLLWAAGTTSKDGDEFRGLYAVESEPVLTATHLTSAEAVADPAFDVAVVNFQLTPAGGRIFSTATAEHIDDFMAIVLDGEVQGTPPVIKSRITRNGQIELSNATIEDAQDLARILRAGALPIPLQVVNERPPS